MDKPEFPEDRIGKESQVPLAKSKHEFRQNLGFIGSLKRMFGWSLEDLGYKKEEQDDELE